MTSKSIFRDRGSLRNIRLLFGLVSASILLATILLIKPALDGIEAEQELRHQILADRVFDEMERELSSFLRREEERPVQHYQNAPGSSILSPKPEDFVMGYFQIEPEGSVTTPYIRDGDSVERIHNLVMASWEIKERNASASDVLKQIPGTTVPLPQRKDDIAKAKAYEPDPSQNEQSIAALNTLNRAAEERQQRTTKNVQDYNVLLDEEQALINIVLEPMVSRGISEERFLLYRTARIDGQRYLQGMIIETPKLLTWLQSVVLEKGDLSTRAQVHPAELELFQPEESYRRQYRRRFAEPFDQVAGILSLEPLTDWGGSTYIYTLSALVVLVATLGLLALYRMVTVVVSYAEQRHNFVSSVTHELKTPLTSIRMYGEMLRDGLVPSEEKRVRYYQVITAETERLTRLVNNVLELAHMERKDRPLTLVAGDVGPVLEEAIDILQPHAREKGFAIRMDVEPGLPAVRFDRDGLLQVLFNLMDNALKYSSATENKEIKLAARRLNNNVSLVVSDHGPGVASRHLPRVFEPFYRGENELTRTSKGTGIGLALVRGLVERMGGTVHGANDPAGGFVVSVSLPITSR